MTSLAIKKQRKITRPFTVQLAYETGARLILPLDDCHVEISREPPLKRPINRIRHDLDPPQCSAALQDRYSCMVSLLKRSYKNFMPHSDRVRKWLEMLDLDKCDNLTLA